MTAVREGVWPPGPQVGAWANRSELRPGERVATLRLDGETEDLIVTVEKVNGSTVRVRYDSGRRAALPADRVRSLR